MCRIKCIQFNADRGKAAMIAVEREFVDKYDVAIIQEPYSKHEDDGKYKRHRFGARPKAEIWTKTEFNSNGRKLHYG